MTEIIFEEFEAHKGDVRLQIYRKRPAAAASEMENGGGSLPNGTCYDMCAKPPAVAPENISCPVPIIRGDHDGIATDADVIDFYARQPHRDKQPVSIEGMAATPGSVSTGAVSGTR